MTIKNLMKGDIVFYRNGNINRVNKPKRYQQNYNDDMTSLHDLQLDIVKVQRFVGFLGLYRLSTIYRR